MANHTNTNADVMAELTRLREENAKLRTERAQASASRITLKVSSKGALSVYGLGRWPVTLYAEQWARLLGEHDRIREFLREHAQKLSTKAKAEHAPTEHAPAEHAEAA